MPATLQVPQGFEPDTIPEGFEPDSVPQGFEPDAPTTTATPTELKPESARNIPSITTTTKGGPPLQLPDAKVAMASAVDEIAEGYGEVLTHPSPIPTPFPEIGKDEHWAVAAGKEAVNLVVGVPQFFTTSLGIGAAAAGVLAPTVVAGAFTVDLLKSLGEQIHSSYKNWKGMSPAEKAVAVTDMVGTGAFVGLTGKHTATGTARFVESKIPRGTGISPELKATAPLTAQAVEETIKPNEPANETKAPATVSEVTTPAAPAEAKVEAPRTADVGNEVLTPESIADQVNATVTVQKGQVPGQADVWDFRFKEPELEAYSFAVKGGATLEEVQAARERKLAELKSKEAPPVPKAETVESVLTVADAFKERERLEIQHDEILSEKGIEAAKQFEDSHTLLKYNWPDAYEMYLQEKSSVNAPKDKPAPAGVVGETPAPAAKPVETPTKAVAKVEAEVKSVDRTEGVRPAKEIKSELVQRLEKAIEDAPNTADVEAKYATRKNGQRYETQPDTRTKTTIEIPGDGTFTIWNTKEALGEVLVRAKKISTSAEPPQNFKRVGIGKEDREWVEKQVSEQNKAPTNETTQGAIASVPPPMTPIPAAVSKPPKSQREIITALAKGLGVPIRFGRLRTSKFAGYFIKKANLIGAKRANDIPLTSHEVGHKLDALFDVSSNPSIRPELDVLGDPATPGSLSSWTKSKSLKYKMGEGLAEFVRYWLVDPTAAQKSAPNTFTEFNRILDANKDVGDVMRQAQEDIRVWRTAEPQARLRSHISVGSNPNKTRYTLSQLTRDLVDDLHFLRLAVDDARAMSKTDIAPSDNPYLLARNLRGSYGMASQFIRNGVVDFTTKAVTLGTSLEDALKPVAGRINDFRDWIVAKRAQELRKQGKETGLVANDVDVTATKFDSDTAFQEAFTKVKAWNDSLLQYAVDSGLITEKSADAMRTLHQDYVPFHRLFEVGAGESPSIEASGIGRGLNVGKPGSLKQQHGSRRDIVDPLETMVKNAYVIITASEKAAINRAVGGLAGREGMGKWVERVASPKELVRVELERIRKELEAAGADLTKVPDDLLMSFFRQSQRAPFGENIIRTVEGGESKFYRLNKDLFDTFNALDLEDSGMLIKVLSAPAQLLRSGVTLAPDFALANTMRDTFSAAILSKHGAFPFEVTIRGVAAMINNPKLVAEWAAAGGKSSVEAMYFDRAKLQTFLAEKITKDLTPAERALVYAKSPLVALRWLTGISEEATRIGEYKKAYDALRESGMPEGDARRQAAFEARDRQDFAKGGAKTKIIRHMAAFWNAQLQANVRLAQAFKRNPLRTTLLGLTFITIPKLLEQAVNWDDEDYWDRPQWERDLFFLIPIGKGDDGHTKFIRIPTPFELGVIFGTLPGRLLQWQKEQDTEAMKGFPALMLKQSVPNPIPQTLQTVFADFLSGKKGWDIWRGRTVVPESIADQPPELQWTEQTSLTARHLGDLLNFSPMKIDHIINSTSGGVGRQLTHQVSDRAIGAVTGEEPKTSIGVPGSRFVSTPAAFSSQAIDDVYTTIETLKTAKARIEAGQTVDVDTSWLATFERTARNLSQLRKRARNTKDDAEKNRLNEQMLSQSRDLMERYKAAKK